MGRKLYSPRSWFSQTGTGRLAFASTPRLEIAFSPGNQISLERGILHRLVSMTGAYGILPGQQHVQARRLHAPSKNHVVGGELLSAQPSFCERQIPHFPDASTRTGWQGVGLRNPGFRRNVLEAQTSSAAGRMWHVAHASTRTCQKASHGKRCVVRSKIHCARTCF